MQGAAKRKQGYRREKREEVAGYREAAGKRFRKAADEIISTITDSLAKKATVTLVGLGTFQVGERTPKRGRNPRTGKELQIPARKMPKFVPGKSLRDKITPEGVK